MDKITGLRMKKDLLPLLDGKIIIIKIEKVMNEIIEIYSYPLNLN